MALILGLVSGPPPAHEVRYSLDNRLLVLLLPSDHLIFNQKRSKIEYPELQVASWRISDTEKEKL